MWRARLQLDGSPTGYYYGPPNDASSALWVIFLQGGGVCYSQETCTARAGTALGSSKKWGATTGCDSICSTDPAENPDFYNAHYVFVPCACWRRMPAHMTRA